MKASLYALIAFFAIALPTAALAGNCGYEYCWGAVGIGTNGEWGYSHSYSTESDAYARVQSECPECSQINTFYNTCGAMATGSNGAYGFGWAPTRYDAESNALGYCSDYGSNCQTVVWACSR